MVNFQQLQKSVRGSPGFCAFCLLVSTTLPGFVDGTPSAR